MRRTAEWKEKAGKTGDAISVVPPSARCWGWLPWRPRIKVGVRIKVSSHPVCPEHITHK